MNAKRDLMETKRAKAKKKLNKMPKSRLVKKAEAELRSISRMLTKPLY